MRKDNEVVLELKTQNYTSSSGYTNKHFINDVLLGNKTPFVTERDGEAALKVALAAEESVRTEGWVKV
jgi:hypothetical protein